MPNIKTKMVKNERFTDKCKAYVTFIPVLIIFSILSWTTFAYTFKLCYNTITTKSERVILLATFYILLSMFMINFIFVVFTKPGNI